MIATITEKVDLSLRLQSLIGSHDRLDRYSIEHLRSALWYIKCRYDGYSLYNLHPRISLVPSNERKPVWRVALKSISQMVDLLRWTEEFFSV